MEALLQNGKIIKNQKSGGDVVPISSFDQGSSVKIVGIYFSAHWCPPCRGFTPKLAEFYKREKAGPKGAEFEIVFVSSDRDLVSFNEYFDEMPWLALDFENREAKEELGNLFGVRGIPTLIFVKSNGEKLTDGGRGMITDDQTIEKLMAELNV